jgi:hypothetical protein
MTLGSSCAGQTPWRCCSVNQRSPSLMPDALIALEKWARQALPSSQRRQPAITINDVKKRLQRWLPRRLQDEGCPLDWDTITKARSQGVADHHPELRSCLVGHEWASFTPKPRWHYWWWQYSAFLHNRLQTIDYA